MYMNKVSLITVLSLGIVYKRRDSIKYNYICVCYHAANVQEIFPLFLLEN